MGRVGLVVVLACVAGLAACTRRAAVPSTPTLKFPALTQPAIPTDLTVSDAVRQRYDDGWRLFQNGDMKGAVRGWTEILQQTPEFYPAEAALGDAALADRQYQTARLHFLGVLDRNARYLPALEGRVAVAEGLGDDLGLVDALDQLLKVDPSREAASNRLDLLRLRLIQGQVAAATTARNAGRLDEAQRALQRALQASPSSPLVLRELSVVDVAQGDFIGAEQHARQALDIDGTDPESLAQLGSVLEAKGRTADAAEAFSRAAAIDPRPAWRDRRDALLARASREALPAEYRAVPESATVTRAQVASMIGIDLEALLARAPRSAAVVVTDVRNQWAAQWILPVTQAGIMDVFPNHTFQPAAVVRRGDLAQVMAALVGLLAPNRPDDVARWRAARPRLDDVPVGHVSYQAIGVAVAAGAMKLDEGGRFWPARPATGNDLVAGIARLKQLAR